MEYSFLMMATGRELYDQPAYQIAAAAHYIGVPRTTLRLWITADGLIKTPQPHQLSWNNLAEAHVLKAFRQENLSMQGLKKSMLALRQLSSSPHPLLDESFATDGINLFLLEEERITSLSRNSQLAIREVVELYSHRLEWDANGTACRFYPFVSKPLAEEPKHISISPLVSFGRPVLAGTGISTAVIAGRFAARDSVSDLAEEYGLQPGLLEDAIRWEMLKGKAA